LSSGAKPDLTKPDLTARQPTPDPNGPDRAYETRIRLETDKHPSRHIPNAVRRAVWRRDEGQCAFVATTGRRCSERNFLEFHHIQPYALEGPATVGNISIRCRRHNAYEAELIFGPRGPSTVGELRVLSERTTRADSPISADRQQQSGIRSERSRHVVIEGCVAGVQR